MTDSTENGESAHLVGAIQTDASINPGNSGSALVDCHARLVGINTAVATVSQGGGSIGLGFAIPIDLAQGVASELLAGGEVRRPSLGMQVQTIPEALARKRQEDPPGCSSRPSPRAALQTRPAFGRATSSSASRRSWRCCFTSVLDDPVGYIAGAGHDKQILFGALLKLLLIIANIGTAVVIFPVVRRQSEELALGYVPARLFECTFILVGIVSVLGIITLRQETAGANEGTVAYTLAAIKDWTFLLGPGWVVGWGTG